MKIKYLFFTIFSTVFLTTGFVNNNLFSDFGNITEETSTLDPAIETIDARTGNMLLDDTVSELSCARNSMGAKIKTGQSEINRVSKNDFENISDTDLADFVARRKSGFNDWFAIVFDDNTAIIFRNSITYATYGEWDEQIGITKVLGSYELINNKFIYKEIS